MVFREEVRDGRLIGVEYPPADPCPAGHATGWRPLWHVCACGEQCRHWACLTCEQAIPDPEHVHRQ